MNPYRAPVNQKLHFAQLLIEQADQAEAPLQEALLQSALRQLMDGYAGLVAEICHQFNHLPVRVATVGALSGGEELPSFLFELQQLEQSGWVADLVKRVEDIAQLRVSPMTSASAPASPALIAADRLSPLQQARQWWSELNRLVEGQRLLLDEW